MYPKSPRRRHKTILSAKRIEKYFRVPKIASPEARNKLHKKTFRKQHRPRYPCHAVLGPTNPSTGPGIVKSWENDTGAGTNVTQFRGRLTPAQAEAGGGRRKEGGEED